MITFINDNLDEPFIKFRNFYTEAVSAGETFPEAISISSFNKELHEVSSRYVNLKFIDNDSFIFFSNYNSPKSKDFYYHPQISALILWSTINIQIRIKAKIEKTSTKYNNNYFKNRNSDKNALAISSNQSKEIDSYKRVVEKYQYVKANNDLLTCPNYWGGFSFKAYEIEFWEGSEFRLNKRDLYTKNSDDWHHSILEP